MFCSDFLKSAYMRMLQQYGQYLQLHVAKNDSIITLLARDEPEMIASGLFIYHST